MEDLKLRRLEAEVEELELKNIRAKRKIEVARVKDECRSFYYYDEVNPKSVAKVIKRLSEWHRRYPKEPIELVLNSPGGYVIDGIALFDFIQDLRDACHVTTRALGEAASMGGILLQAGTHRVISPHSFVLIHEIENVTWGKTSAIRDDIELQETMQERLFSILAERSTLSAKKIKKRCHRKDWWLDADEALDLGFVDEIA